MHRRDLLKLATAAAPALMAGKVWAMPASDQRVLVVFLRGAYDAANVVIPTGSDFYYQSRPTLQIARPDPANPAAALPLDADWSLHPALKDSLYPLWLNRQLAFVPFAGTDDMTRSHFETQDAIELGQPGGGPRDYGSGFLSRLYGQLAGRAQPIAFTAELPLSFRGGRSVADFGVAGAGRPAIDAREARLIEQMYQGRPLAQSVAEGFKVQDDVYRSMSPEMAAASRGAASPKGFSLAARRVARLMRDEYNLGFIDVGGWDTHVNQGAANGQLAQRLGDLGRGLAAFADEIGPDAWGRTTVVVISEFGRTFRENGDRGTDHGHGSVYWVLGGQVKGGRLAGEQLAVTRANLNQDRDWPVLTDYRALFGGLFQRLYGLNQAQLQTVFPGAVPKDLQIV